ncbi:uncharacterized protein LOC123227264 isoform X3 [Mangifera indica]|uniref:uncharacterized protein LOC123227264 isoform X3 n=1 Tax=Mangifera indica TaxID=29780 RepID=UPI001CF957D8|nr:uncharacterized protein LOC123227264 isoform X3 [Mangifera indica]
MEEMGEGRLKAMGSASAIAEPIKDLTTKTKEEGELSSSDDDEHPASSVGPSIGTVALPGGSPFTTTVTSNQTEGTGTVKTVSAGNPSSSIGIQSRTSIQPTNQKSFEKNRMKFKSGNPGWFPNSGLNNNLVISFSDGDSGSDTDDYQQEKTAVTKSNTTGVDSYEQRPAISVVKTRKIHQNTKNANKIIPKKLSSNRIFVSSITKNHGGGNSRDAERGSRGRNFNNPKKNLGSQEHGFDLRVGLKNSKLQDLRQQIALRETELKLKAAQQNKDMAVVQCRKDNAMNLGNEAARKYQSPSADVGQSEQKEPDKKRFKGSGSYSHQLTSDSLQEIPVATSIMPVKEPTLENSMHVRKKVDLIQKDISVSRRESSIVKQHKQDDKHIEAIPENVPRPEKDVADINSDKDRRPDPVVLNQMAAPENTISSSFAKNLDKMVVNHPITIGGHPSPIFCPNKATGEQNVIKSSDHCKPVSCDKTIDSSFHNLCQVSNASLWNCLADANVSGRGNMDVQSIIDMEELMDKELEEAQEHRRMCEIEERNALKAYRKAQRALIEANARCTKLYRQRELYSARFYSFMMDDSNLLWSSRLHEPVGNGLNLSNHVSENVDLIPASSHQVQSAYDGFNRPGYGSNIQCVNGAPLSTSYQHASRQNLGSEPCSEPDASTSEPLPHKTKKVFHGLSSLSNELNVSADENEETFPLDHEYVQHNFEDNQKEQTCEGRLIDKNSIAKEKSSIDGSKDSIKRDEATLRSEMFAQLGMRILSKNSGSCYNTEPSVERGPENDLGSDKMHTSNVSIPSSEGGQSQQHYIGGTDKPVRSFSETPVQSHDQCNAENISLEFHATTDFKENENCIRAHHSTAFVLFSPSVLRSVFGHLKVGSSVDILNMAENQHNHSHNFYGEEGACVNSNESLDWYLMGNSNQESLSSFFGRAYGSYTCNPFWPLCMYELRGKCNNDECPWQHVKDFSNGSMCQHQHDDSGSGSNYPNKDFCCLLLFAFIFYPFARADCQVESTIHQQGSIGTFKCHDNLTTPIYIVGLDILKADSHSYESIIAGRCGQCWQKCFSITLALSNMFQMDLPAEFLNTGDGRIEVCGGWNRQSSYFQSRDGIMNHLKQALPNNVQSVELALLFLNQEAGRLEGIKKALYVLSRALEADRSSEILWIVYLLIYHSNTVPYGRDDMFFHAVKHNEGSYGLWLMYINSRIQLDGRLDAYNDALSALCRHASSSEGDERHASACILDLFLQMVECLCMSGNIEKAIQKICGLFLAATSSKEAHSLLLSDILTCLTISDKLIFWVSCVYLVIYRKLPNAVVQRFECEKELLAIEWPSIHLLNHEKQRAVKLVETAVDSVESYFDGESPEIESNIRSRQLFAVCHVRCMVALDDLECSWNLLDKYIKLHPSCLELVLISVRLQKRDCGDSSFMGFEEALLKWPKEIPGIQCIWNQYAEYALLNGRPGFAKELMDRWFHSVWKVQYSEVDILGTRDGEISHGSLESTSASNLDFSASRENQMDVMFGLLNLSLHKLLQNHFNDAKLAIDKALKVASPEHFNHCVREHAMFLLTDKSGPKGDALLNLLKCYLDNAHSFPFSEPLPRHFINNMDKPRVRQLVTNLICPISTDFSLVNLILEVWYGPSLLPQMFSKLKDLVDFVEAIMEIVPSNYPLAFSVCKLLSGGDNPDHVSPASVLFWAASTLVTALFQAMPIAPEYVWAEAADILGNVSSINSISVRFFKKALSVYPFSLKLWKCYYNQSNSKGDKSFIVEAAREKGIELI